MSNSMNNYIIINNYYFFFIGLILMIMNFFLSKKKINDREKLTPFECGFDPFNSSRLPFSVQFYMIGIIFLIFDVEIIILLPMMSSYFNINFFNWLMLSSMFISILLWGLYIEWKEGALKWLK